MANKFALAFFLIALQLSFPLKALAALTEPDQSTLSSFKNYAVNGGAEQNKAGWAVSGTSSALSNLVIDATNKYEGNAGFAWTPANADNFLTNAALSLTANQGLSGRDCAAILFTKTSATGHQLEAYDGTNVLASVTIPASTSFTPVSLNWPCSSSGSNRVRFNAGDTTVLYYDSLKWGDARGLNLSQVSQAAFYGSATHAATASCAWTSSATSMSAFAADADCPTPSVTGSVTAPATKVPGFVVQGPGKFKVDVQGAKFSASDTGDGSISWTLSDGTITCNGDMATIVNNAGEFTVTTPTTSTFTCDVTDSNSHTFSVYVDTASGTTTLGNTSTSLSQSGLNFQVYRFPLASEQAYRPDQIPASWAGYSSYNSSTTSTSYSAFTNATNTVTQTDARNMSCVALVNQPGITCTVPKAGKYKVTAHAYMQHGGTASVYGNFQLYDATNSIGIAETGNRLDLSGNQIEGHLPLEGFINAPSTTFTVQIRGKTSNGASGISIYNGNGRGAVEWTVSNSDQATAIPYLMGSVTSNSTGQLRLESAYITNSGTCAISRTSSSWISSLGHPATGYCTVNIVGAFSSAPNCVATSTDPGRSIGFSVAPTSTTMEISRRISTSNADEDGNFMLWCMGPR